MSKRVYSIVLVTAVLCIAALGAIGTKGQDSHTALPQFDVPPIERKAAPTVRPIEHIEDWNEVWLGSRYGFFYEPPDKPKVHRACADKSRFLLMSQDGVWHCLDFSVLAATPVEIPQWAPMMIPGQSMPENKVGTPVEIPKSVWDSTTFRYMLDADVPYLTIDNYGTIVIKNCTVDWAVLGESLAISCTPGGNKVEGTLYLKPSEPKP